MLNLTSLRKESMMPKAFLDWLMGLLAWLTVIALAMGVIYVFSRYIAL
jgi:uncharacterized protein involved in cysteine biosynthesis